MAHSNKSAPNNSFQLKGGLFTLTSLQIMDANLELLRQQLSKLVKHTPKFFQNMPIVLDLQKLPPSNNSSLDLPTLLACLRQYELIPIGIRGASLSLQEEALSLGLAVLPNTKTEVSEPTPTPANSAPNTKPAEPKVTAKVITQPVRSGQQIYARHSDLIVLATVSPGAELLADGNIHVYGTLRGRALAGVNGNSEARIFCNSLAAELVAIAGHYWLSEDLQHIPVKEHIQIYLADEKLHISGL